MGIQQAGLFGFFDDWAQLGVSVMQLRLARACDNLEAERTAQRDAVLDRPKRVEELAFALRT